MYMYMYMQMTVLCTRMCIVFALTPHAHGKTLPTEVHTSGTLVITHMATLTQRRQATHVQHNSY